MRNTKYPITTIIVIIIVQLFSCDEPLPEKPPIDERLIGEWVLYDEVHSYLVESIIDQSVHEFREPSEGKIAISGMFQDTLRLFESFGRSENFKASFLSKDIKCEPADTLCILSIKIRNGQSELEFGRVVYDPSRQLYVYLSQYDVIIPGDLYDPENRSFQFNNVALNAREWSGSSGTIWLDGNISNDPSDITTLPANIPTEVWSKYSCPEKVDYLSLDFGEDGWVKRSEAMLGYIENDSIGYEIRERDWKWTVRNDSLILYSPGDDYYVFRSHQYSLVGSDLQLQSESDVCVSWDPIIEVDSLKCMADFEKRARLDEGSIYSLRYVNYSSYSKTEQ